MKFSTTWFKDLPTDQHAEVKSLVLNNGAVIDRLRVILQEQYDLSEKRSMAYGSYDKASWPYYQAHLNGEKAMLTQLLDLLDVTKE